MRKLIFATLILGAALQVEGLSQERKIRDADVFWKKRVVNRISLIEKINKPLVAHSGSYFGEDSRYPETNGIVVSLLNGVKKGKYLAIHPDDWAQELAYTDLRDRIGQFESDWEGEGSQWEEDEEDFAPADDFLTDDSDVFSSGERESTEDDDMDWPFEDLESGEASSETVASNDQPIDYTNFEKVFHIVEDWVFDKGSSEMVQRISFFEIIWVDPTGVLPERVLARFKWEDVKEQLEETKWQNFHNEGQSKSMKEIIALRRFNSLIIHLGNRPIRSLHEAIAAKRELIEFEHNLWSY